MLDPKTTTVEEVMNDELLTLTEDMPVDEAVRVLEDYHITGAPVLNSAEDCVGVFSTTDILKRRREVADGEAPRAGDYFSNDPFSDDPDDCFAKEDYDDVILGRDTVGQWMTTEVKTVVPGAPIREVCRQMVNERIHRVLVMKGRDLLGIVSTFDIVLFVAQNDQEEDS